MPVKEKVGTDIDCEFVMERRVIDFISRVSSEQKHIL